MLDRIYYSKEAESLAKRQHMMGNLAFLMLGLGIGATFALLFAPKSGERVRELVAEALEEGFSRGREATEEALQHLAQEYPGLHEKVEDGLQRLGV
ncbi:MAG: YtxH domain-containing protein [Anaerolineae bacterium]|nr:YtxH domain-containing protein [Anaerolineae bacterium]